MDKLSGSKRTKLEHILNRAIRSGYPLEIEISSIIKNDNWIVFSNDLFLDEDETGKKISREVDIHALYPPRLSIDKNIAPFFPRFDLIVECKKSTDYAWVFFVRPTILRSGFRFFLSGQFYDFLEIFTGKENSLDICSKTNLHYNDFKLIAKTGQEIQIDRGEKQRQNQILTGKHQLIGFINYLRRAEEYMGLKDKNNRDIYCNFAAIVFDGELYEMSMKNGEPKLSESNHILLQVQGHSRYHGVKPFSIDIVSKKYFPNYLKKINEDIALIKKEISSNCDALKRKSDKILRKYRRNAIIRKIWGK